MFLDLIMPKRSADTIPGKHFRGAQILAIQLQKQIRSSHRLKIAKALGLTLPRDVSLLADEVIE